MGFQQGNRCARSTRRMKGTGYLVAVRGHWVMRWRVSGRYVQEATRFATNAAGRKKAEALLMERTEINRLRDQRDRLQVLISRAQSIEQRIREIQASASVRKAVTLGAFVELWRNSPRRRDCSSAQAEHYAAQIGQFVAWAGDGVDVRAVDDDMAEHYSGNTYNKHLNVLDAAWAAVGKSAGTDANPLARPAAQEARHARSARAHGCGVRAQGVRPGCAALGGGLQARPQHCKRARRACVRGGRRRAHGQG